MFAVAILNPIVAATSKRYDTLSSGHARGGSVLSVSDRGLWLRQGSDRGQTVIHADRANLDGTELYDVTFLTFSDDGTPITRITAISVKLEPGVWMLSGGKNWPLAAANPEQASFVVPNGYTIPTELTKDKIRDSFGAPSAIGFWDLPGYIKSLEVAGFSARSHRVWYQMELAQPLLLAAMVLIAAGFTMRHARMAKTGSLVLTALLLWFCGVLLAQLRPDPWAKTVRSRLRWPRGAHRLPRPCWRWDYCCIWRMADAAGFICVRGAGDDAARGGSAAGDVDCRQCDGAIGHDAGRDWPC